MILSRCCFSINNRDVRSTQKSTNSTTTVQPIRPNIISPVLIHLSVTRRPRSQSHNWKRLTGQMYDCWLGVDLASQNDWRRLALAATQSDKMCILAAFYHPPLHGVVYTIIFMHGTACRPIVLEVFGFAHSCHLCYVMLCYVIHWSGHWFLVIRSLSITSISIRVIFTSLAGRQ